MSVVKPDLRSLFCPKLILKQVFLSHHEGYIFTLIKTMPLMDKDINVRGWVGGGGGSFFLSFLSTGCRSGKLAQHPLFV